MEIKALSINHLPSYEINLLQADSIILCKFLDDYENFKSGNVYSLRFEQAKELQNLGLCYFSEKVIINTQKGGFLENGKKR
jgi:hypothetical protein